MSDQVRIITSRKNPNVIFWRSLKEIRVRREHRLVLLEGEKLTGEALSAGLRCHELLMAESYKGRLGDAGNVPVSYQLPDDVFQSICETKTPQGIAGVFYLEEPHVQPKGLILALDAVQDPGNVGTMIRTADAAGFQGVVLSRQCADAWGSKALRAGMGSHFHLPVETVDSLLAWLMQAGKKAEIIVSQLDGELLQKGVLHSGSECRIIVIGNEGRGVSEEVKTAATCHVRIPMTGKAESLNAAVAAGLLMYHFAGLI